LLQIHNAFPHNIKLRTSSLSAVTISLHYLARCLRSTITCGKTPSAATRSRWTFEVLLCYCYAKKTNDRIIRSDISQPASAGERADMSELQAHHCIASEQWTWL